MGLRPRILWSAPAAPHPMQRGDFLRFSSTPCQFVITKVTLVKSGSAEHVALLETAPIDR